MDRIDELLLRRLKNTGCHMRLSELCDTCDFDLPESEVLERLNALAEQGMVRPLHYFKLTVEASEVLDLVPPRHRLAGVRERSLAA